MSAYFFSLAAWYQRPDFLSPRTSFGVWVRVLGRGLHVSNSRREDALFSERYGHTRAIYLLGLRFATLKPDRRERVRLRLVRDDDDPGRAA